MEAESLNLIVQRDPVSVWDKPGWQSAEAAVAVPAWMIASAGILLGAYGVGRRNRVGAVLALAGSGLIAWAIVGGGRLAGVRDWMSDAWAGTPPDDQVHQASDDSFPASDAPPWTSTAGAGTKPLGRTATEKPESAL